MTESEPTEEHTEITVGKFVHSNRDGLKQLRKDYDKYLWKCTALAGAPIKFATKTLPNIIMHMTGEEVLPTLSALAVCKILRDMDREDPPVFLPSKMQVHPASYVCKIIQSSRRVVEFFASCGEDLYQPSDAE